MTTDRILQRSAIEFEHGIEKFADMLFIGYENPNAFEACLREHPDPAEGYMRLLDLAERAKRARSWFARNVPCRYQKLPLVHYDEQEKSCAAAIGTGTSSSIIVTRCGGRISTSTNIRYLVIMPAPCWPIRTARSICGATRSC